MQTIRLSVIRMPACRPPAENPLPQLRARAFDRDLIDSGLTKAEKTGFSYSTGDRVLPYRVQDGYDRQRRVEDVRAVVLENDALKAVFLPDYGGRLYSLYQKKSGRELLFRNPVLQMANLAVRNAWFSGGIEWNLGQYGHSALTAEPVYFASIPAPYGGQFLRLYAYERIKGLFEQLDFHLPEGAEELTVHARLYNPHSSARSFYWWTNIAVELRQGTRVLSGTDQVIATAPVDGVNTFSHDVMPHLRMLPDADASFPAASPFSAEYFFQNPEDPALTFEAAVHPDDTVFFERSTPRLRYRKMFCWSNQAGGQHWQQLLSEPGASPYLEIQAGVCPTQVHGCDLAPGGVIRFTQAFGGLTGADPALRTEAFLPACRHAGQLVEQALPYAELARRDRMYTRCETIPADAVLTQGGAFASVEELREPGFIPPWLTFAEPGPAEQPWKQLLTEGVLPPAMGRSPRSFETDLDWIPVLEHAYSLTQDTATLMHLSLALYENGCFAEAQCGMRRVAQETSWPIAWRTLCGMLLADGETEEALACMERAMAADALPAPYYVESIRLFCRVQNWQAAWDCYASAPAEIQGDERVRLSVAPAALELGRYAFLEALFLTECAGVREGEVSLTELFFGMRAAQLARAGGLPPEEAMRLARQETPPALIDFRTN